MKIGDYLKIVVQKIGPDSAFSLMRDARFNAIEEILIEKGIATKEEIEAETDKQLGEIAKKIEKMPVLLNQNGESPKKTDTN